VTSLFGPETSFYLLAGAGALLLMIFLLRIPYVGGALRILFTLAMVAVAVLVIAQRAPLDPYLAGLTSRLGLDRQEVVGKEMRIKMSPNGHFVAKVRINGVERRMMIDSGATVTALSEGTAQAAGIRPEPDVVPIVLQTANGMVRARTATLETLNLGNIVARDLKVVISPSLGNMDLLGMNFLSKLKSWRVEEGTLVLVPHHPQPVTAD
jgi:aspartyl protease family protein